MVHAKNTIAVLAAAAAASSARSGVAAQTTTGGAIVPLISQRYAWPYNGPDKLDSTNGPRGLQQGDNVCTSVAGQFNQSSNCIISHVNSLADFCLWGPPAPNSTIADTEGEEVAWCTKAGYGTRLIPDGALKGVQFVKTPDYVAVAGYIDQTLINMQAGDTGGELDPHGADNRGNPIGSLMYSTAFSGNNQFQQVIEWHNFMGGNLFCIKACNPASANAASMCQHIYDRIGCAYNVPLNYAAINGTFQSCAGDDQIPPGLYVVNGVTSTYQQPAESLGVISTIPYTAVVPATSQCTPFSSAALYTDGVSAAARLASASSVSAASVAATARTSTTAAPSGPSTTGASGSGASATSSARTGAAVATAAAPFGVFAGVVAAVVAGLVGAAAVAL